MLNGLALCTEAVLDCSDIVVAGGGLPVLLGIAKAPGRGKEAAEALRAALACLTNICRSRCWDGRDRLPGIAAGQHASLSTHSSFSHRFLASNAAASCPMQAAWRRRVCSRRPAARAGRPPAAAA